MTRIVHTLGLVALGATVALSGLGSLAGPTEAANLRLKKGGQHSAGASAIGGLTTGFSTSCAPGFSMAGKDAGQPPGWTDWYVCSTGVIVCPTQIQSNGLKSGVTPKAVVQITGGNPDGGTVKFRVQYKCDYSWTALPEG